MEQKLGYSVFYFYCLNLLKFEDKLIFLGKKDFGVWEMNSTEELQATREQTSET